MSTKSRLSKLEPRVKRNWDDSWDRALLPPRIAGYLRQELELGERLQTMTQAELNDFDRRFRRDRAQHPALQRWDDGPLMDWLEAMDRWLEPMDYDPARPDFTLWPWQAPPPPDVPP